MAIYHQAELVTQQRILVVVTAHNQSAGLRTEFPHTPRLHAEVLRANVKSHSARTDIFA